MRQDIDALLCVSLTTHSPGPTCSSIIHLGQHALVTQREVNVKQIVCLPLRWQTSAMFARRIRRTAGERRELQQHPSGDCFQTSDTPEMRSVWIAWHLKNFWIGRASRKSSMLIFPRWILMPRRVFSLQCQGVWRVWVWAEDQTSTYRDGQGLYREDL